MATALVPIVGDGVADDTAAIQALITATPPGGKLSLPPGTYAIDSSVGLKLQSDLTLDLTNVRLTAKAHPGVRKRALETVPGAHDIHIIGGLIIGSRVDSGDWGIGLRIDSATRVTVDATIFDSHWFDGIYVGGSAPSRDIVLRDVQCRSNRRTGLAIVNAVGVLAHGCRFIYTSGQDPQSGVNVEPSAGERVTDVTFRCCEISDNAGCGLYTHRGKGAIGANYRVVSCLVERNANFGLVANETVGVVVLDSTITGSRTGVSMGIGVTDPRFYENTVNGCPRPFVLAGAVNPRVIGNNMAGVEIITTAGFPGVSGDIQIFDNWVRA